MLEDDYGPQGAVQHDQEPCCEQERAVYDCPNCKHREYRDVGSAYAGEVTCELNCPGGVGCYEDTPHRPDTFPSMARLVGFRCPVHGWSVPPHLRQAPLPEEPKLRE